MRTSLAVLSGVALSCIAGGVQAAASNLTVDDESVDARSATTMQFVVERQGDLSYPTEVRYQTEDGTAISGREFAGSSGRLEFQSGQTSKVVSIPVYGGLGDSKQFAFRLDGANGFEPVSQFSFVKSLTSTSSPTITLADVNGDRKADLLIPIFYSDTVWVLINETLPGDATPTYQLKSNLAAGDGPSSVAVADINGDGRADLVVAAAESNVLNVLLGSSTQGASDLAFDGPISVPVTARPDTVAIADVNADGKPDLLASNSAGSTVSVSLNRTVAASSTPSFSSSTGFDAGSGPSAVTVADLNGDGRPDVAVVNAASDTMSVILNATSPGADTPAFSQRQAFATGDYPIEVTAADLNSDGKLDLLAANFDDSTVTVLYNATATGSATVEFSSTQTLDSGAGPQGIAVNDMNLDGRPDILTADSNGNQVSVLYGVSSPGSQSFRFKRQDLSTGIQAPIAVVAADMNGDGKAEIFTASSYGASVMLNEAPDSAAAADLSTRKTFPTDERPFSVEAADLNGDGRKDLLLTNVNDSSVSALINSTPAGAKTPTLASQLSLPTGQSPYDIAIADFNGDGRMDFATADFDGDTVSVRLADSGQGVDVGFSAVTQHSVGQDPIALTAADMNGDGRPDLLVANSGQTGSVSVLLNSMLPGTSVASFAAEQRVQVGGPPTSLTTADINSDGKSDLVATIGYLGAASVLLNSTAPGAGALSFSAPTSFATQRVPTDVVGADINGDGKLDLLVTNLTDNSLSVLLNATPTGAATPSFRAGRVFGTGVTPRSVVLADMNGDGKLDALVANSGGNSVSLLINRTAPGAIIPAFAAERSFSSGPSSAPNAVAVADLNGDGKPDVISANAYENAASVWLNAQLMVNVPEPAIGVIRYSDTITPAAAPSFAPPGGTYSGSQSVTLSSATAGAVIYYTTNGTSPTTSSSQYTGPISVSGSQTILAIATAAGYTQSTTSSATYTITVPQPPRAAAPVFSPPGGSYSSAQSVTISSSTAGAEIYYTTDGSTPSSSSTRYVGQIAVLSSQVIRAIAVADGFTNSNLRSASYSIVAAPPAEAPVFSPPGGVYTTAQSVSISSATPDAAIYYTTDGTIPTIGDSLYTGPVVVSSNQILRTIATINGAQVSGVSTASYTIQRQTEPPNDQGSGGGGGAFNFASLGLLAFAMAARGMLRSRQTSERRV